MNEMYHDITFPDKTILEVTFLNPNDFYEISFQNSKYIIVGGDKEILSNLIGIGENGKVYYITTDDNIICYISANINIFIKELLLYDNYMMYRPDNLNESQLIEFTEKFRHELLTLDKTAFLDENTYWSEMCEEMEYGF